MSPSQSTLPTAESYSLANDGTYSTRHADRAAVTQSRSCGPRCVSVTVVEPVGDNINVPPNAITAASHTPSGSRSKNNQPYRTPHLYIQGLWAKLRTFLTRVSGNEVLAVTVTTTKNPPQCFYLNPLVSDVPWTHHAHTDNDQSPAIDNNDDSDIKVPPSGLAN
jgi:hypothetical protein